MGLRSMTGFASRDGALTTESASYSWTWDIRSVNGKSLDVRFRLPSSYFDLEQPLRKTATEKLSRGNVNVSLSISVSDQATALQVNEDALATLLKLSSNLHKEHGLPPLTVDGLLSQRSIFENGSNATDNLKTEELKDAILADFDALLDDLIKARSEEGAALKPVISNLIDEVERLANEVRAAPERSVEAIKAKIRKLVDALMENSEGLSEDRLHQEAVLLMTKADVQEELDRLDAHVKSARAMIDSDEPFGRRFDFLTQEFNREANTLCSKSNDTVITNMGLALKGVIDQLREQIQNIE